MGVAFRPGGHSFNQEDLDHLLSFADLQFRGIESEFDFSSTVYDIDPEWDTIEVPQLQEEENDIEENLPGEDDDERIEENTDIDPENDNQIPSEETTPPVEEDLSNDHSDDVDVREEWNDEELIEEEDIVASPTDKNLPNTATSNFTFLLIGSLLLISGSFLFLYLKRSKKAV